MHKPIRLLLADDHAIVREGLAALLQDEPDLEVVGQAGTGGQALKLIWQCEPDVALLDITMGDMTGLEATRQLTLRPSKTRVIILTMHDEPAFFFEALRAGACGYILKGSSSSELLNAVRAVHNGGVYLSPQLAGELVQDYTDRNPRFLPDDLLTPREKEILILIAQGFTNRDIAEQLTLSVNTVKSHRLRIYQKLNVNKRGSLVNYALRRGLLNPPSRVR